MQLTIPVRTGFRCPVMDVYGVQCVPPRVVSAHIYIGKRDIFINIVQREPTSKPRQYSMTYSNNVVVSLSSTPILLYDPAFFVGSPKAFPGPVCFGLVTKTTTARRRAFAATHIIGPFNAAGIIMWHRVGV